MTEKRTGRPAKYTEAQVLKGIEIVERGGELPTGDTVKKAMCSRLGVAGGINAQSLGKEVERLIDERDRQRRDRLITALPSATRGAAKEIASLVEAAVLDHMGEQHDRLRGLAGKKVSELSVDLCNQREQIRELLSRIDTKDAEMAGLEEERDNLRGRLDLANAEIASLKERIAGLEQEDDFQARMLAVMKQALGERLASIE